MRPCLVALLVLAVFSSRAVHAEDTVSVFLTMTGASVAEVNLQAAGIQGNGPRLAAAQAQALGSRRRNEIKAQHDSLEPALQRLGATITGRFVNTLNAVRIRVPVSRVDELATLPGVTKVRRAHLYHPLLTSSIPWIGAPSAWTGTRGPSSLTGEGIRIGIIDSGIDYTHADFGGSGKTPDFTNNVPTRIEPGTFPTAKVVGGWDFVGDNYNASDLLNSIPVPDPDPLDTSVGAGDDSGHGTHVAAIAAGFGVSRDGSTYRGSYDHPDFTGFTIAPGVAPAALLYALKVFGSNGSSDAVIDALDWAADPNHDGDTSDRLDVVVLSLGTSFGSDDSSDPESEAITRLTRLGTVIATAAGNEGNTAYILSSPAVFPQTIAVANSLDAGDPDDAIQVTSPPDLAGIYAALEGTFTGQLADIGAVSGELAATTPENGCGTLTNTNALRGHIALVDRGTCFFADKIRAIQHAGAIAVIVVNNVDDPPLVLMGSSGDASDIHIPAVMISKADGQKIRDRMATSPVKVTLVNGLGPIHLEQADTLDKDTSRGPGYRTSHLKPDLAAPGTHITSARAGSGTKGITYSGTSMATPHVGGAAALLRQAHPDWPAEDIKAALMNTAVATHDADGHPYPESRTGAGRIQVDLATLTSVVAKVADDSGEVSVSFGALELSSPIATNKAVRIVNHGNTPVTLALSATNTLIGPGVHLAPAVRSVTVAAHASATFDVVLEADPALFGLIIDPTSPSLLDGFPRQQLPESSGEIWLHGDGVALHVPWYGVLRATANFAATTLHAGTPTGAVARVTLPTRGTSAHAAPLVSVFQLGLDDTNLRFPDARSATDIVAVGAATDYLASGSMTNTTLYFAIATAGHWVTPQRARNDFDVEIDIDGDGLTDFTVINATSGTYAADDVDAYGSSTDAQISVVRDESTGAILSEWPINMLLPDGHDTSPFLNGAMVQAAQASDIGLTETFTKFRYRVLTRGDYFDRTPWISFDAANAVVDGTPFGIDGTPFFDEGLGVTANIHRASAGTNSSPRVLLLHQHNVAGRAFDIVTLNLSTADLDGDGLPDAWELANFGDLSYGAGDDPDGDGVSNAVELAQGTSPNKVRILPSEGVDTTLRWQGVVGRRYTIERADAVTGPFHALQWNVAGSAGINTYNDPELGSRPGPTYYRLKME